eukprot:Seg3245.2 transcript_id=Seg3245.2/GoldUCD/mRNA.D3Y31 product="UPF0415 protein C7orf25-like" protein_id=Seg3245.2/GoldUCD/D3Y31
MSTDPIEMLSQRTQKADQLIERVNSLGEVNGYAKLLRRVAAERDFLKSLEKKLREDTAVATIENQLKSSNLVHLETILTTAEGALDVKSILKRFSYPSSNDLTGDVVVDVEGYHGKIWFKVFARNPYALHSVWEGLGQYGDRDVCAIAREYQNAANANAIDFVPPKVVFMFGSGVTKSVADDLESMDILVLGEIIEDPVSTGKVRPLVDAIQMQANVAKLLKEFQPPLETENDSFQKVNLDITTLIALVSSLSNGNCNFMFEDDILTLQAEEERAEPILPILNSFMQGKELYVCKSAVDNFKNILTTIGGVSERDRAKDLISKLKVIEDCPSQRALGLMDSAKIKERSRIIFGSGDSLKAKTTTANRSFVRAAHDQGVDFNVYFHSSRALTERKEEHATVI